ncbi:hypothetical protein EXN51_15445 [Agrobacterium fabrum]|uniref:Uncharacterized protein n=1 Tax=Agrobacterium fabrum (strain C58 / ATCC 33970) TaxID=176299 RepID=Q8UKA7_AGRFC|nr:hypothetical protein Atu5216 [Agrobacterium fabrum str. C58]TRB28062.1 hypothetical protein EXN51_15445 [Agrobacterium fabrum]
MTAHQEQGHGGRALIASPLANIALIPQADASASLRWHASDSARIFVMQTMSTSPLSNGGSIAAAIAATLRPNRR